MKTTPKAKAKPTPMPMALGMALRAIDLVPKVKLNPATKEDINILDGIWELRVKCDAKLNGWSKA
jgi:hypothetical protein